MPRASAIAGLGLDKLIHEKARLKILTYVASGDSAETAFTELRDALGFSAGNLSVQLRTLEEAGYVSIEKSFRGKKPYTGVRLSVAGRKALDAYMVELETILAAAKAERKEAL